MTTKILAVDDSRMMQRIVSGSIEMLGYEPLLASHGQEALDILQEHSSEIILILLDWNMPVMNGLETLKALKASSAFKDIPVMMVTTESEQANVVKAIQLGAKNYLTKPFSQQDLSTKMMECLGLGF